jgi:hypothetical protein
MNNKVRGKEKEKEYQILNTQNQEMGCPKSMARAIKGT